MQVTYTELNLPRYHRWWKKYTLKYKYRTQRRNTLHVDAV